jgi:hypothetical protein
MGGVNGKDGSKRISFKNDEGTRCTARRAALSQLSDKHLLINQTYGGNSYLNQPRHRLDY